MKTDSQPPPSEELRPQLDAIIGFAERLKMTSQGDENVQQILSTARGLLNVINREPGKSHNEGCATPPGSSERTDVLHIEDDALSFRAVELLLRNKRKLSVLRASDGEAG